MSSIISINGMRFSKYEAAGNDFILVDNRNKQMDVLFKTSVDEREARVVLLCDRRRGVGSDGLLEICSSPHHAFRLNMYNPVDGRLSTLCGNGSRCAVHFYKSLLLRDEDVAMTTEVQSPVRFQASDGTHVGHVTGSDPCMISISMLPVVGVRRHESDQYYVNTGSPHLVVYVPTFIGLDVKVRGSQLSLSECFADVGGTNVMFVTSSEDSDTLSVRSFERGVGESLACGTGATAVAIVDAYTRHVTRSLGNGDETEQGGERLTKRIAFLGGTLTVGLTFQAPETFTDIILGGNVNRVFEGEFKMADVLPTTGPTSNKL